MYIFQSTLNTRQITENCMKYIRSDVPVTVSESERLWLLENNVTTVVDLRTEEERARKPCPLTEDSRFSYYFFPISGGDRVPDTPDGVSRSYIRMADEAFDELIEFLMNASTNVLYFCNAGKDRTGVVSAALLYKLGKPIGHIVDDYMKSKECLEAWLEELSAHNPSIDLEVITPHKRYIQEFMDWYINREKS
ncbi:MAG: tyrosine-protein phosphatase [Clostridia bacterium]|nr:tyrosine-protein phosphatase [Clostridia bacterium]